MATCADAPIARPAAPWRGVNLGGWLLLEPGPADPLFDRHLGADGEAARCEWGLMEILRERFGAQGAAEVIQRHREAHVTRRDFERIRACGLNAVRLPLGYWVVLGPRPGDPYAGPGLAHVDRALDWAEACGLQVVLDLHGCPGGESGEAPCGRRQRPQGTWRWRQWDMELSLRALEVLCRRYRGRACVTGVAVCNEPSNETPLVRLCEYYGRAMDTIRGAGMPAGRVAALLPVFQRPEDKFAKKWRAMFGDTHKNFCFDVHCYHCFENEFSGKTFAQQLRHTEANERMFQEYPMVVGEWSLALGQATWATCGAMGEEEVYRLFGRAQLAALRSASHGHFFWNWTERREDLEWNFQVAFDKGLLSGAPLALPAWDGRGEDPLEERCNPAPSEDPRVLYGERVCLRVFYGRYVDVRGAAVNAQWPDKGAWQSFTFRPVGGGTGRREIRSGDVVCLRPHNGRYLSVGAERVEASKAAGRSSRFVVHLEHGAVLAHRGVVYLESRSAGALLDADDAEEGLFARYADRGDWQQFAVEKLPRGCALPTPKNRPASHAACPTEADVATPVATPVAKRRRMAEKSPRTAPKELAAAAPALRRTPSKLSESTRAPSPVAASGEASSRSVLSRAAERLAA